MRLINTSTMEMYEFFDDNTPAYAILSHRWEQDEFSFWDHAEARNTASAGYQKVCNFCKIAARDEWEWAWIDTCCIDKRSSAELSEAINSMYRWYKNAGMCYAYLSDTQVVADEIHGFDESKWFTRGWTLQELLAPRHLKFFDCRWQWIGTKLDLASSIAEITGIHTKHLCALDGPLLKDITIGEKMSWAAKRSTSRTEDIAYCLLGLFGINMPLLYGEGKKAFYRLQREIIKESNDMSLFVWEHFSSDVPSIDNQPKVPVKFDRFYKPNADCYHTLFALSPRNFWLYGDAPSTTVTKIHWATTSEGFSSTELEKQLERPYGMTNQGLQFGACIFDGDPITLGIAYPRTEYPSLRLLLLDYIRQGRIVCLPIIAAQHLKALRHDFNLVTNAVRSRSATTYHRITELKPCFVEVKQIMKNIGQIKYDTIYLK